jgi:type II secretory pathway component PulJ
MMVTGRIDRTACRGLTTVELLVGLAVGLFISAGLLAMWLKLQTSTLNALAYARLNQDLRAITTVMANDIRRAGYRAWSPDSGIDITVNPFMTAPNAIAIDRSDASESLASCLTYSYDLNQDGLPGGDVNEYFGFRLHAGAIEMRIGGMPFNCHAGTWQDITQAGTVIDRLHFSLQQRPVYPPGTCISAQPCVTARLVVIELSGHLTAQPTRIIDITRSIQIANDQIG